MAKVTKKYNGYLLGKFSRETEYNAEATVRDIIKYATEDSDLEFQQLIQAELAENDNLADEQDFHDWCTQTVLDDPHEYGVFDYPSQARGFIEDILPHALDLLLAKIEKGEEQCIVK